MTDQPRPIHAVDEGRVVDVLERRFAAWAGQAPGAADLPARVRGTRRRQTLARSAVGTGAALAVAAAIALPMALGGGGSGSPVASAPPTIVGPSADDHAADGWRWESYGGIELEVPAEWGYGVTNAQWCGAADSVSPVPYVGRPGPQALMACGEADQVPPENSARYVWLDDQMSEIGRRTYDEGWVQETRAIGNVVVTVQLDDADLAEQILASARVVTDVDAAGCPAEHQLHTSVDARPKTGDLGFDDVGSEGSVCQLALVGRDGAKTAQPLLASHRMTAEQVRSFVDAVAQAPLGGGPDDPNDCSPETERGEDGLVVRLPTDAGVREVYVWYSGCVHGVDDGTTVRAITVGVLAPLFHGAVRPTGTSTSAASIVFGAWRPE